MLILGLTGDHKGQPLSCAWVRKLIISSSYSILLKHVPFSSTYTGFIGSVLAKFTSTFPFK
ncbi:MAG: hypothetical protein ABIM19_07960, partial [candidate division WOR-3 bacterium]